jgi:hypothetical protein
MELKMTDDNKGDHSFNTPSNISFSELAASPPTDLFPSAFSTIPYPCTPNLSCDSLIPSTSTKALNNTAFKPISYYRKVMIPGLTTLPAPIESTFENDSWKEGGNGTRV